MESNVSLIVLTIVLVLLVVILPVYNIFTRQDDMSYNIALKAVTNFVDEARTTGRIAYSDYDNLINQLGITKNSYQIEIEEHKNYYLSEDGQYSDTIMCSKTDKNICKECASGYILL